MGKKLSFIVALFMSGCVQEEIIVEEVSEECTLDEEAISGTWAASGTLDNEFSWFLEYVFQDGDYTKEGYPPLWEEGEYELSNITDQTYTLMLTPKDSEGYEVSIIFSKDCETIDWNGTIFSRVK